VRKAQLLKEAKSRLKSLGDMEPMDSRLTWRYRAKHEGFTILTYVDLGGRFWDLSYHHDVLFGEARICRFVSFLSWLGIGAAKWTLHTREEGVQALELLSELSAHFLGSLDLLLRHDGSAGSPITGV
jgi:hypothetical protein